MEEVKKSIAGARQGAAKGPPPAPDPEVPEQARRRQFSAEYKLGILSAADGCDPGEIGALLRREGLYSSHLSTWRRQQREGALGALERKKRGRKTTPLNPLSHKVEELERENRKLKGQLKQAEAVIEVQKKISEILGLASSSPQSDGSE